MVSGGFDEPHMGNGHEVKWQHWLRYFSTFRSGKITTTSFFLDGQEAINTNIRLGSKMYWGVVNLTNSERLSIESESKTRACGWTIYLLLQKLSSTRLNNKWNCERGNRGSHQSFLIEGKSRYSSTMEERYVGGKKSDYIVHPCVSSTLFHLLKRSQCAWCAGKNLLVILNLRFWARGALMGRRSITRKKKSPNLMHDPDEIVFVLDVASEKPSQIDPLDLAKWLFSDSSIGRTFELMKLWPIRGMRELIKCWLSSCFQRDFTPCVK